MVRSTFAGAIANALLITIGLLSIDTVQSIAYEEPKQPSMSLLERSLSEIASRKAQFLEHSPLKTGTFSSIEQEILSQINQYRDRQNLPPLEPNATISQQAQQHSEAMASGQVPFSHNGFDERIEVISQEISYSGAAENVAFNQGYGSPADRAVNGWLESTRHRQNIEGNYDLTGIGVARSDDGGYYFTQIFVRQR